MALIQCKECGHMISDKATTCPKCGCAVAKPAVCSDCGEPLPEECTACPKCGC
ncbi:MAG: zinc-ribbon domain-containing protein, partial [Alloprevotella sp.]|nr:zinc-ribbon domain-containing protein [Alloprevotella sp.]